MEDKDPSLEVPDGRSSQDLQGDNDGCVPSKKKKKKKKKKKNQPDESVEVAATMGDENVHDESEDYTALPDHQSHSSTVAVETEGQHGGPCSEKVNVTPSGENQNPVECTASTKKRKKKKKKKKTENTEPVVSICDELAHDVTDKTDSNPTVNTVPLEANVSTIEVHDQESHEVRNDGKHTEEDNRESKSRKLISEPGSDNQQRNASGEIEMDFPNLNTPENLNVQEDSPMKKKKKKKKKKNQENKDNFQPPNGSTIAVLTTGSVDHNEMLSGTSLEVSAGQKIAKEQDGCLVAFAKEESSVSDAFPWLDAVIPEATTPEVSNLKSTGDPDVDPESDEDNSLNIRHPDTLSVQET